jgi:phosphohistidine phosphatase
MDLILWRHANAVDSTPDSERKLSPRGIEDARAMGDWLRSRLPSKTTVLASPARRAQQTARALMADFETVREVGTQATARDILAAVRWPEGKRTVVVVGHQPTLGRVAALLLTGREREWALKKGGLIWIAVGRGTHEGMARLRVAISPRFL